MGYPQEEEFFQAPKHPSGDHFPSDQMKEHKSHIGHAMFDAAFNFYAWYLSHDDKPTTHTIVFEYLSQIMQIAKLSCENGVFLSAKEETMVTAAILDLSDSLTTGFSKCSDIAITLETILKKLTDNNSRALICFYLVKLEYRICIHDELSISEAERRDLKTLFQSVMSKIVPELPDLVINTLARDLTRICSRATEEKDLIPQIKEAVKILEY